MSRVPFPAESSDFSLHYHVYTSCGAHSPPPPEWILGAVSPDLKHPDLEADSSTPAGVEMKNISLFYLTYIYLYAFTA